MLLLAIDHTAAHTAGGIFAIALTALGAVFLAWRALDLRGRRAAAPGLGSPAPIFTAGSFGPPGFAEPQRPYVSPPAATRTRRLGRSRRDRVTDTIAAGVCAAICIGATVHFVGEQTAGPWDTPQARQLHAGFVAGCGDSPVGARLDCECLFEHLTSGRPGNTPAGFASLIVSGEQAMARGGLEAVAPVFRSAALDCLRG